MILHYCLLYNRSLLQKKAFLHKTFFSLMRGSVTFLVGFVALRPKSTAMVIAGRSVHLTTLFPGQA